MATMSPPPFGRCSNGILTFFFLTEANLQRLDTFCSEETNYAVYGEAVNVFCQCFVFTPLTGKKTPGGAGTHRLPVQRHRYLRERKRTQVPHCGARSCSQVYT